jgi:rubrerythrin
MRKDSILMSDTASEPATVEVEGITRQALLLRGALAAGAVYGAGMVMPFVRSALAQDSMADVDVLNFALTLEYLEADFYRTGLKHLSGDARTMAKLFGAQEAEHVAALRQTITKLGGKPAAKPTFEFGVTDQKSFLKLARTLEDTGVSAYNGAAPAIKSKEVLAAVGSIVQVEARHAAVIRQLTGAQPAPNAFDPALDKDDVLKAVQPLVA